jgi:hypothetical protein
MEQKNAQFWKMNYLCAENIQNILEHFGIRYSRHRNYLCTKAFCHGGDYNRGLSISDRPANGKLPLWSCWSCNCHNKIGRSILELVKYLIGQEAGREVSLDESYDFLNARFGKRQPKQPKVDFGDMSIVPALITAKEHQRQTIKPLIDLQAFYKKNEQYLSELSKQDFTGVPF